MYRFALVVGLALWGIGSGDGANPKDWAINATAIEACSCPHFCMCYFNSQPTAHHENGEIKLLQIQQRLQGQPGSLRQGDGGQVLAVKCGPCLKGQAFGEIKKQLSNSTRRNYVCTH
jgi:hypothetical protein